MFVLLLKENGQRVKTNKTKQRRKYDRCEKCKHWWLYKAGNTLVQRTRHIPCPFHRNKFQLSYSCFAKKFSEHYSMSCKEYIEQQRIFMVEEMLLFTDFDLTYISNETGFSDCSHMIKSFKKHKGITPKKFRMIKRAGQTAPRVYETAT